MRSVAHGSLLGMCLLALLVGGPGDARAYSIKHTSKGARVRWYSEGAPILVGVQPTGDSDKDQLLLEATAIAVAAWNERADLRLVLVSDEDASAWVTVAWAHGAWPYEPRWLGATESRFDEAQGGLVAAHVIINDVHHAWSLDPPDAGAVQGLALERFDLAGTVTHELGHAVGLEHSEVAEATMSVDTAPGDLSRRTLERDDLAAVLELYGPPRPPDTLGPLGCSETRVRHAEGLGLLVLLGVLLGLRPRR